MTIRNINRYSIPKVRDLTLNQGLVDRLRKLQKEGQENVWRTFLYAAGLRDAYLKDGTWDKSFTSWYKNNQLQLCFGTLSQFSKCASAGEVINRFATLFPDKDDIVAALPTSMNALYEISLLIKGKNPAAIAKLVYQGGDYFEDDEAEELGIISPVATAESIRNFRIWNSTTSNTKPTVNLTRRKKEFSVPIATIYANKSLFKFGKKGTHEGCVDLADIKDQIKLLKKIDLTQFDVRDRLPEIEAKYEAKKEKADPVNRHYSKTPAKRGAKKNGK